MLVLRNLTIQLLQLLVEFVHDLTDLTLLLTHHFHLLLEVVEWLCEWQRFLQITNLLTYDFLLSGIEVVVCLTLLQTSILDINNEINFNSDMISSAFSRLFIFNLSF